MIEQLLAAEDVRRALRARRRRGRSRPKPRTRPPAAASPTINVTVNVAGQGHAPPRRRGMTPKRLLDTASRHQPRLIGPSAG